MEGAADLDAHVALDPLLIEPLDLYGGRARRRHIADALGRAMGIDDRTPAPGDRAATMAYLWRLVDPLVSLLEAGHSLALDERAREVARSVAHATEGAGEALSVLIGLGAGPVRFAGGTLGDVCYQVRDALRVRTEALVLALLRRWCRAGYIRDVDAAGAP